MSYRMIVEGRVSTLDALTAGGGVSRQQGRPSPLERGRTFGTAWFNRRLKPDITMMSPLCINMAVGASSLLRPPRRKMADCPKLQKSKTTHKSKFLLTNHGW